MNAADWTIVVIVIIVCICCPLLIIPAFIWWLNAQSSNTWRF